MPGADVAAMYAALLSFTGTVYPDNLEYVDRVLATCYEARAQLFAVCFCLPPTPPCGAGGPPRVGHRRARLDPMPPPPRPHPRPLSHHA